VTPSAGGQFFCTPAGCRSHASIYQAPGGALVFATGSIQWVWRLDDLLVPGVPPGALDPYRFPPAERMARNLLDAFRDSPCIETPEWSPPVIPPEFTLALPVAAPGVTLVVDRCQAPGCLRAKQELGPKFSVVLLHPADFVEVEPPPLPPQLPPLPGFAAVSELFVPSLLGPVPQGASVVELTYDEQGMSPQVEKQVALFAFTDLGQGPVWHPLQVRRDVARNAVRATVGSVAPFVLALPDGDADGVANALDNCAAEPNPGQSDTGGVEPAGPDGIGDACQCGDVDDDGVVRAADRAQLRAWLAGQAPSLPAPQKCSVSAPQSCSIVDATRLARALGASLPPLAQVCAAAN
jgi:hypothetical protein